MNILVIKANNRPANEAVSSKMYETFMESLKKSSSTHIQTYDLFKEDMPYLGQELFDSLGKLQSGGQLTEEEQRLMSAKQKAMDAVEKADVLVFAFPLWNLTIPARLHTFIDYIYSVGFTFKYDQNGQMLQLLNDKKVIFLNARGGNFSAPEMATSEHAVNYMYHVFHNIFGMEVIDQVIIEGHNAMPEKRDEIIADGLEEVKQVAAQFH
ncbi:FMN-dependent NADH-azoreductase [Alkalihalobacillus pseudalcaliphilus]|uniref:FMN-dependent NADH-azoreductase n=1 Tax=Alkalihalobacillus pseudalcaliphilus TaxID=79884 RepID=UPI00064D7372|nr:FMN-dependent NADH-azoreductase [Alkalihalobacillus pseudalcaliphilus]KMK75611.1 FMN-dependent NADH-azoreductase [Alkalihalobacillus pseudalcaliphilus]